MPDKDAYELREIFEEITLDLLHSLRRTFKLHQLEQEKEGFAWEQWQAAKLRHLAKYRKENRAIIEGRSKEIESTITKTLDGSFILGGARAEREIMRILFPGDISKLKLPTPPPETGFFGINTKKLDSLKSVVTEDMERAQQAVLRKMDDIYRQTIFRAEIHMSSGAKTLDQAIDMATKDFLDAGIQCIEYKDGRRVNVTSYAEMALRTASQRAILMGEGQQRNKWGVHTVVVSAHANTCDLCLPWQRQILIDDVYSLGIPTGQYPLLSQAMEEGLFHPNCRHLISTFFPGITSLPKPIDEETTRKNYEAEQKQRYIERQIRRWKRREVGSLDAENVNAASKRVNEWQNRLKAHIEANQQLRRDPWREISSANVDNWETGDILSNRKWLKAPFSTEKRFERHIKDHLKEYGDITPEKYLNMARDLLAMPLSNDIDGFVSSENYLFKYRKSTNDFAIGRPDGRISTLFKPVRGEEYWEDEKKSRGL